MYGNGNLQSGFMYNGEKSTTVNPTGGALSRAVGINDADKIVGWYSSGQHSWGGYLSDGDTYIQVRFLESDQTYASGINNSGDIVGHHNYLGEHGFLLLDTDETGTTVGSNGGGGGGSCFTSTLTTYD